MVHIKSMNHHIYSFCTFTGLLLFCLTARADDMWDTVYHDEHVTIELRRDYVTYGSDGMPQVRFRWTFAAPRALKLTPGVSDQLLNRFTVEDIVLTQFGCCRRVLPPAVQQLD